jgi:hypothetical protein
MRRRAGHGVQADHADPRARVQHRPDPRQAELGVRSTPQPVAAETGHQRFVNAWRGMMQMVHEILGIRPPATGEAGQRLREQNS